MPPAPQAIADVGVLSALPPAQELGVFVARGGSRGSYRFPGRDNSHHRHPRTADDRAQPARLPGRSHRRYAELLFRFA
jgi:hypothetical protein